MYKLIQYPWFKKLWIIIRTLQEFREVHDYLRALLKSNEVSARALSLTEHALKLNPANYTTWQYRRVLLKAMDSNLDIELEFNSDIIEKHPKNYQVVISCRIAQIKNKPGI